MFEVIKIVVLPQVYEIEGLIKTYYKERTIILIYQQ